MPPRRYAEQTTVAVSKSRAEIDEILRAWGADGIQWTDSWRDGRVQLRFIWHNKKIAYRARFDLKLKTHEELSKDERAMDRYGQPKESKLQTLIANNGKQEHRVLLLWLKAAFNAVDLKITTPEAIFLSFLEDNEGQTVAERVVPRLQELLTLRADRLLEDGKR